MEGLLMKLSERKTSFGQEHCCLAPQGTKVEKQQQQEWKQQALEERLAPVVESRVVQRMAMAASRSGQEIKVVVALPVVPGEELKQLNVVDTMSGGEEELANQEAFALGDYTEVAPCQELAEDNLLERLVDLEPRNQQSGMMAIPPWMPWMALHLHHRSEQPEHRVEFLAFHIFQYPLIPFQALH
jgi:hypothetical protein